MTFLNYVPCKLASQRISQKNVKRYQGRRLIDYTLDFAVKTGWPTLVSSEDADVLSTLAGVETHVRQGEVASRTLTNFEVMQAIFKDPKYDLVRCVVLLQPTHPLRKLADIQAAAELFIQMEPSVPMVSVKTAEYHGQRLDRRRMGEVIDGRFYLYPMEYIRRVPQTCSAFIGYYAHTGFHVDIDTTEDEETLLRFLSQPAALREEGYDV